MKKVFLMLIFFPQVFSSEVVWNNGPTKLLEEIFKITKIKYDGDLDNVTSQSTAKWIRPNFMANWHAYSLLDNSQKVELAELLKHSDLAKAKMPKLKHYDVVVILGCSDNHAQKRINFLIKLHNQGVTFGKIYVLGKIRELKIGSAKDKKIRPTLQADKTVSDKMTMAEYVWQNTPKPESLKLVPVHSFKARKNTDSTGATTENILTLMLDNDEDAKGKNFLFISNGHCVCYHDALVKKALEPYEANVETVGDALENESVEKVLVSVAKCLIHIGR